MFLITTKLKLNQISPVPPANDEVVDLSSAQDIDGDKTFHHTIKIDADSGYNTGLALINISKERNQRMISSYTGDMETIIGSVYWNKNFTTNNNRVGLRATKYDGGSYADLYVSINPDGTPITYAPTPETTDNSTKIATTAFVNNRLPYETGTWTPELKGYTTAGAFTYSTVMGYYVKIGTLVYINAAFNATCTTAPAGAIRIYGLPFTANVYTNGGDILVNETSNDSLGKARFCRVQDSNTCMSVYGEDLSNSFRKCSHLYFSSSDTTGVNVACDVNSTLSMRIAGVYYSST